MNVYKIWLFIYCLFFMMYGNVKNKLVYWWFKVKNGFYVEYECKLKLLWDYLCKKFL